MSRREFLLPLFWRLAAAFSALACGMIVLRLFGRFLTPGAFGVVVVALTILNYLPLLDGGFRLTINRLILAGPNPDERRRLLQFYETLQSYVSLAALVAAAVAMTAYWAGLGLQHTQIQVNHPLAFFLALALVGALAVGSGLQAGLLVGLRAQEQTFFLTALNAWVNLGVLWLVLRAGLGVWAFPLAMLATMLVTYALAMWLIAKREPGLSFIQWRLTPEFRALFRQHRSSAWDCFRSQVVTVLLYTIDLVFVGFLCGPADAGIYAVLSRVFTMLRTFLLSSGEVTWPMIAQKGTGDGVFQSVLERGNAWLYGCVAGPVCVSLIPFCRWFVGESWTTSGLVLGLMVGRFVITGLATPAAYALYGLGEFKSLTRCLERELVVASVLALLLGFLFKLPGVASAFLIATAFGTLYPIVRAYAQRTGEHTRQLLARMWWRTGAGFVCSLACASFLAGAFPKGVLTLIPAAAGALAGLALAIMISFVRTRLGTSFLPSPVGLTQVLKQI